MVSLGIFMKNQLSKNIKIPDYLTPLLEKAPATWALIRANEIRALDKVKFKNPILDVGCGDGFVAKVVLSNRNQKIDWGIDLSSGEIEYAKKSGSFKKCKVANVYDLPFKDRSFSTVFSNSVIEHIPDLGQAISEMSRVLKKGGKFIITVPTPYLTAYLMGVRFFNSIGLNVLAREYGNFFNRMFVHHNLLDHKQWQKVLGKHKLKVTEHYYYHTPAMVRTHEFLAYLAVPYGISKYFFKHWVVFPKFRKVFIVPWLKKLLYPLYLDDVKKDEGGSLLIVAEKTS